MGTDLTRQPHERRYSDIKDAYDEMLNTVMSFGKCKLKQKWDTATNLLELPKPKTLTTNVGQDVENRELPLGANGNAK